MNDKIIPKSTNPLNDEGISECFSICSTKLYLSLAPCHIKNPINGIKSQHLDPLIMNYFLKADGVVVGYSNIKITDDQGNEFIDRDDNKVQVAKISDSSPFTFFWITVDLLVWRPQLGDILEGYIYMQTASHIGLLVHDTFNASIKKYNIPPNWEFIPNQIDEYNENDDQFKNVGYWQDENGIKIEGKVQFTIKSIHTTSRVINIDGTLIKPGSEPENQQPILRERRASVVNKHKKFDEPSNGHKRFDDEPIIEESKDSIPEDSDMPQYSNDSD